MPLRTRRSRLLLALLLLIIASGLVWAKKKDKYGSLGQLEERQAALHALNRLTFGPRPGDVDRVLAMGLDKWIELQLHPDKIDDSALQARLSPYRTLSMSAQQMGEEFPPQPLVRAIVNRRRELPRDPIKRAIYQAQIERFEHRQQRQQARTMQTAEPQPDASATKATADDAQAAEREARMHAELTFEQVMNTPADKRFDAVLKMDPQSRDDFVRHLRPADRLELAQSLTPQQREAVMAMVNPEQVVVSEMSQAKILRAAYSERQLQEVMTDFWFNHFNIFIGKGADRYLTTEYERDVIRAHAFGKFKDLLLATAKSPAMLFYLDNWDSIGPDSDFALGRTRQPALGRTRARRRGIFRPPPPRPPRTQGQNARKQNKGLNENYARELMELHTLGVDGGYTQKDVQEVAKIFTGWTLKDPRTGGSYTFDERRHEHGTKMVLGHKIKENGEKEGVEVLELLARHPSTARFISKKLATRFVSDDPPDSLVKRMVQTFLKTDGDVREVLRTMLRSPEFWSASSYRAKVKTPLEFVVSAIRSSGAEVQEGLPLVQVLNRMGMPLYGQQPPTGYPMKADAWVNSAALLSRMNFAVQLASGRMPGVSFDSSRIWGSTPPATPEQALARLEDVLLGGDISKQTHNTILKQMSDPKATGRLLDDPAGSPNIGIIAGLILGSPEFQRR